MDQDDHSYEISDNRGWSDRFYTARGAIDFMESIGGFEGMSIVSLVTGEEISREDLNAAADREWF